MSQRIAKKVLLIGWDAADWQLIHPLIQQGKMPCLAKFIEDGVHGNLASIHPMLSPMLWTSIATGKRAYHHGICGFTEPTPDGDSVRPVSSTSRTCKAVWNILTQKGLRSNIVGWFASHPAEPIRGAVVTNYFSELTTGGRLPKGLPEGCIHPESLREKLFDLRVDPAELTAEDIIPFIPRLSEINLKEDKLPHKFVQTLARTASVHNAVTSLMLDGEWDFTAVYYGAIDVLGHHFMQYHPPRMPEIDERDFEIYKGVMEGCYRYHDMMLDALLQIAGEEATVVLVSDHGYISSDKRPTPEEAQRLPEASHRFYGIAALRGPAITKGEMLYGATLLDVTPTILSLFGLQVGGDMEGRAWAEIFRTPRKVDYIPTWEMMPGDDGMHDQSFRDDPEAAASAMLRLIDLGYMNAPSEDMEKTIRDVLQLGTWNLAQAHIDGGRSKEAIPLLAELTSAYPDTSIYLLQLIECYVGTWDTENARRLLDELDGQWTEHPQVLILRGALALCEGKIDNALAFLEKALEKSSSSTRITNLVGKAYVQLENFSQAATAYQKTLTIDPENPFGHDGLAQAYVGQGEFSKSLDHALKAVGFLHHFPSAHFHLGVSLANLDFEDDAIVAFETCLSMAVNKKQVHVWLARLYGADDRDPDKAHEHKRQAYQLEHAPRFFSLGD